jgi:hypothetical protein
VLEADGTYCAIFSKTAELTATAAALSLLFGASAHTIWCKATSATFRPRPDLSGLASMVNSLMDLEKKAIGLCLAISLLCERANLKGGSEL